MMLRMMLWMMRCRVILRMMRRIIMMKMVMVRGGKG